MTKFKQLLRDKDLHCAQLGRRIGVSPAVVWKWANGKSAPHLTVVKKIAEVLNISTDEVIACFERET